MALCLGILRWPPDAFWRATPREVSAALEGFAPHRQLQPPDRSDLDRLLAAFPDEVPGQNNVVLGERSEGRGSKRP